MVYTKTVERWGVFEAEVPGCADGNPFVDCDVCATFEGAHETLRVAGFYDGNGRYKVRFMPSFQGAYHFSIEGSFSKERFAGDFLATPPFGENHGPVRAGIPLRL